MDNAFRSHLIRSVDTETIWYERKAHRNTDSVGMIRLWRENNHNPSSGRYSIIPGSYCLFERFKTLPPLSHRPWTNISCPTSRFDVPDMP